MNRLVLAVVLLVASSPGPSMAQNLLGEWQFRRQGYNGIYSGTIVIDQSGQARHKGRGPGYGYIECGYVQATGDKTEIVFTFAKGELGGYSPDRFYCVSSGERSLACYNSDAAGHREPSTFTLTRTGELPASPAGRFEDICPVQERPTSQARPSGGFG
jgi:hypothetical protein